MNTPPAGRLVMVDIEGQVLGEAQARFLREHHLRAVCLFRGNLGTQAQVRRLTADLRAAMGPRALIGILPQPPAAMALGAAGDEALADEVGAAVSRGLKSLGFNWNFAPVLDVNNNPANPVIGERSFGEDPHDVARLAGAWMRGALREGVACCVKHFPGHGDTHVDSHRDLPVVDKSLAQLEALELVPFKRLRGEAPAMMTAHIVYPQLDPAHPATLSQRILGQLLRNDWGYDGVVITDSLVMKAIHERYGHPRAAVMALQAGADMVMALGTQAEQLDALRAIDDARASGRLAPPRMLRSVARLDALAMRYPSQTGDYTATQRDADELLMQRAWAMSLTVVGDAKPPLRGQPIRVFTQRGVPTDGVSEAGPTGDAMAALFGGFANVEIVQLDALGALDWADVPGDGRFNLVASNHKDRYDRRSAAWRADLHLVLWNPYQALDVPAPALVSWGHADGAMAAVRAWLEGRGAAPGRAPITL